MPPGFAQFVPVPSSRAHAAAECGVCLAAGVYDAIDAAEASIPPPEGEAESSDDSEEPIDAEVLD